MNTGEEKVSEGEGREEEKEEVKEKVKEEGKEGLSLVEQFREKYKEQPEVLILAEACPDFDLALLLEEKLEGESLEAVHGEMERVRDPCAEWVLLRVAEGLGLRSC